MGDRLSTRTVVAVVGAVLLVGAGLSIAPVSFAQDDGVETPAPSGSANDPYDCGDFESAEQVRAVFADEAPGDESDLDRDDDNIPCEDDFPDQSGPVNTEAAETATATATATPTATEEPTETETETETAEAEAEQPTASVTFDNQSSDGVTVVVESVTMSEGGFVAIHNASLLDGNTLGSVVGVSEPLSAGTHENVEVTLFDVPGQNFAEGMTLEESQTLIAMPHFDSNANGVYDFITSNASEDGPYTEDGSAVVDPASITLENKTDEGDSDAANGGNGKAKSGNGKK